MGLFSEFFWFVEYDPQVTVWWAGLMRGAVSVALAYKKVKKPMDYHIFHQYKICSL